MVGDVGTPYQARLTPVAVVCWIAVPFLMSKLLIAACTAYQEYLFGVLGGAALSGEADSYRLLFSLLGTAMGGLRASSILVARRFPLSDPSALVTPALLTDDNIALNNSARTNPRVSYAQTFFDGVVFAFRGSEGEQHANVEGSAICWVPLAASLALLPVGVLASVALFHSRTCITWIATNTNDNILASVHLFGKGAWWGALPTLLLYNKGQVLLGAQRSLVVLLYAGVVYNGLGMCLAFHWYASFGVEGIGWSLSASAWVAYLSIKAHVLADRRLRYLSSEYLLLILIRDGCRQCPSASMQSHSSSSSASALMAVLVTYMFMAVPLSLSNAASLMRQLLVAAVTTDCSTNAATAYSVSTAYYDTVEIGMLAASSTVSAVAALDHRRLLKPALLLVGAVGVGLGVLPLVATSAFAHLFGGSVYAFGDETVDSVMPDIRLFNYLACASYMLALVAMGLSGALHGHCVVWSPLCITLGANGCGAAWAIAYGNSPSQCSWGVGGSLVANTCAVVGLSFLLTMSRRFGWMA